MNKNNIDLGEMTSREIGNKVSKTLVDIGKEVVNNGNPTEGVDYGDLPSRTLTQLGKQAVANYIENSSAE